MITLKQIKELGIGKIIFYEGDEALAAVKQDGCALKYVKKQTPEICLAAVKQDGWALLYVHSQTPEICLVAVKQWGHALKYVHSQTPEICLAAVEECCNALQYVDPSIFKEEKIKITLELTEEQIEQLNKIINN
tara:strand:- start:206 stop:607 length:402 start_codon:yes stop_codon:yes gene_type:complete